MAPPVTPSPHRFLAGQRRPPSPTKEARQSPAPRAQYKPHIESHLTQPQTASSQFAPTPRFGKIEPSSQRRSSSPKPVLARALRASLRSTDAVEDATEQDDDEEMLDNEQAYAVQTTENDDAAASSWTNDLALSPKRRRLEPAERFSSPERPTFKRPQTPASHFAKAMPRVLPPQTQESIATQASTTAASRPSFLRSSVAPSEPGEPLPDAFSPHRRGQKNMPGGMAATMQQWVLEAGQSAVQSRKGQGYLRGEDYVMRVKVESMKGDGPHVVSARTSNGEPVNLILAGAGQPGAARTEEVARGSTIGVRAPSWTVELEGEQYAVAVDWRLLQ